MARKGRGGPHRKIAISGVSSASSSGGVGFDEEHPDKKRSPNVTASKKSVEEGAKNRLQEKDVEDKTILRNERTQGEKRSGSTHILKRLYTVGSAIGKKVIKKNSWQIFSQQKTGNPYHETSNSNSPFQ